MRSLLYAAFATGIVHAVHASNAHRAPRATTFDPAATHAVEKRADPTATVTLGPSSNYDVKVTSGAPNPQGTSFSIVAAGDKASDGFNVHFGPDLKKNIGDAIKNKCGDTKSADCHNAILDLLPIEQVQLQRRQVGLLIEIGIFIRYAITGIILAFGAKKAIDAIHAPQSDAEHAQSPTSASAFAIVPSADASPTIITAQPSDKPDPTPFFDAGDGQGFSINAETSLVQRTNDLAGRFSGGCPGPSSKRDLNELWKRVDPPTVEAVACMIALTVALVRNMAQGPLAEWVRVNRNNRQIDPRGAGAAVVLANVNNQVAQIPDQVGLARQQFDVVVRAAYWQAYNRIVLRQFEKTLTKISEDDLNLQYCPPKDVLKCNIDQCKAKNGLKRCADDSDLKGCECSDGDNNNDKCPPKEALPACSNCGGDAFFGLLGFIGAHRCKGVQDKLKDCPCWQPTQARPGAFKSAEDLKAVQSALLGLKDLPDNPPRPTDGDVPAAHCELRKRDASTGIVNIETNFFMSLVKTVCKDYPHDIASSFDKTLQPSDAADNQYKNSFAGYHVQFKWDDKPGTCDPLSCEDIFKSFTGGGCSASSHSMHDHGENELDCGKASFKITVDPPVQEPAPIVCPDEWKGDQILGDWASKNACDKKCPGGKYKCDKSKQSPYFQFLCQCDEPKCMDPYRPCFDPNTKW
ncbi:MAG: hypothetical protein Q9160_003804 [Pyrenula sp. 1 TL-2023]